MGRGVRVVLSWGFAALAVLPISGSSAAQIMFERTYGDSLYEDARCVRQTRDGGYILAGYTSSYGAGESDWYFVRTDSTGKSLWSRTYGTDGTDRCYSVLETANGNFVASGNMSPFLEYPSFWLLQMDSSGDTIWAKNHGQIAGAGCVVRGTSDRGHITVVTSTAPGDLGWDLSLVKTDLAGEVLWREVYGDTTDTIAESGYDVVQTVDGGYMAVGVICGANELSDVYLIKANASGQMTWSKRYAGPGTDRATSVVQTPDGGYLVAGWTSSFGAGDRDVYLIRTDSLGDSLWTRTYGGPLSDGGLSLDRTSDGAYVVAGWTESYGAGSHDVLFFKVDSTGDVIWMRTYGGKARDLANSVRQTEDGGYILAGETYSYGAGDCDVYLIKTNEDGLRHHRAAGGDACRSETRSWC
jgi:hypothetical protein